MNDLADLADLARYERLQDRNDIRAECFEPMVRDALQWELDTFEPDVTGAFVDWLHDDATFIPAMLNPGERTHKEIIADYQKRWIDLEFDDGGWQSVNRRWNLNVEDES